METIVIDTSALFALLREDDLFHEAARDLFDPYSARGAQIVTTSYALVEAIALAHRRRGFDEARRLINFAEQEITVVAMNEDSHTAAVERYIDAQGQSLSLVDWTLVLLARNVGARVFTFDRNISGHGVTVMPESTNR